ncbi:TPA: hypothetical protein ACH3X2_009705 [Trebouxia sp. C0005]|nr:MAG: pyrroline-5-carboxylate reductase [Trebouxia sp. A1-2]
MPSKIDGKKVGFVGAGAMAEALARGFVDKKVIESTDIWCCDPSKSRMDVFTEFGANAVKDGPEIAQNVDIIFISVKPQYVGVVIKEMKPHLTGKHIMVSIAAGIPLSVMKDAAGEDKKIIRVMPNTPCLVGEVASAMCLGGRATEEDSKIIKTLFSAVGFCCVVDEKLLSAVTGLSGSGPAYVFVMIEAMADGGVKAGLPRDIAQQLAAQTVFGSAKMVLQTGKHPGQLKDMVTSPAGTTIAGVHELEKVGVRAAFMNAVTVAANKADSLASI